MNELCILHMCTGDLTDLGSPDIQISHYLASDHATGTMAIADQKDAGHRQRQKLFSEIADFRVPFDVDKYRHLLAPLHNTNNTVNATPSKL